MLDAQAVAEGVEGVLPRVVLGAAIVLLRLMAMNT